MYQNFFSTRKLLKLKDIKKVDSEYGSGFISYRGFYTNPLRQKFQLTATSLIPDTEYALRFLQSLKVCFEALEAKIKPYKSGEENFDLEPELKAQADLFSTKPYVFEALKAKIEPYKSENIDLEAERKARADLLSTKPYVDVLMEWLTPKKKLNNRNLWLVHFFIDPTIDADDGIDGFRAKCAKSAWVQPDLTNRTLLNNGNPKITATLYRVTTSVGSTTASAQTPLPSNVSNNNGSNTSYDVRVSGTKNQMYSLYGSWTENNSGIGSC